MRMTNNKNITQLEQKPDVDNILIFVAQTVQENSNITQY